MKIFEGKSPADRNKLIAAIVLGTLAVLALGYTFKGMFFPSRKTSITVKISPSPTPLIQNAAQNPNLPSQQEMDFQSTTTPIVYFPSNFNAPDPGRNIFAFYEPGKPTPYSPTPVPLLPTPTPATPTPTPPIMIMGANPGSVYAGAKSFRLEILGERFTPDSVILFNGSQLPTTYVSPQNIYAQISDALINSPGTRNISVITPGGLFSNMVALNVQEPPKPQFKYIGMIARKRYNNDTAYFSEQGKENPIGARLNDVIGGRFRLKSISAVEVVFEDVNLGFRHKLALYRPTPGESSSSSIGNPRNSDGTYVPYAPPNPNVMPQQGEIPGIPNNIPRYDPTPQQTPDEDPNQYNDNGNDNDNDNP